MLIKQKLEQIKLSPSQKWVAQLLIDKHDLIKEMTITKPAKETYTSTAIIICLAKNQAIMVMTNIALIIWQGISKH